MSTSRGGQRDRPPIKTQGAESLMAPGRQRFTRVAKLVAQGNKRVHVTPRGKDSRKLAPGLPWTYPQ